MKKIFSLLALLVFMLNAWGTLTPVNEDFSSGTTGWTSGNTGRYTVDEGDLDGNKYVAVNSVGNGSNGALITGTTVNGSVTAGTDFASSDDFTMIFDMFINGGNNQATWFCINDASNNNGGDETAGTHMLSLHQSAANSTTWEINGSTENTVVLAKNTWFTFKLSKKGAQLYFSVKNRSTGDFVFERKAIDALSTVGGLGNIKFATKRYYVGMGIDNIVVRALQDGDAPAGPPYSINYKLGSTIVKTESGEAPVGDKVNAKSPFTVDNQKYFIVDGAQTEFTIANSGNNFDVAVRKADNFSYTVNAVAGSMSTVIGQGTVVEGESASVAYPQYVNVDGTLYKSTKQGSNPWWGVNVTPTSDNFVYNINYTQAATGIVICYEVEGIKGATVVTTGNADIRCSNKAGGFFADANGGVVTKLQPGVYKLFTSVWGNAGATLTFKAGEKTILEAETKGYIQDYNTDEFIISEPTDIIMVGGSSGNAPKIADFVYIQKTADYVATDELTINLNEITIGETAKMTATLLPANASNKTLTWTIKESNSIDKGEAEIDAATGEITPLKAGLIAVEVTNGEKTDTKEFAIAAAQFDVTITDAPQEAQVFVGDDASVENKLYVSTKAGYDDMQNTSLLQPVGSVTATKIPTYIYSITVDKKNKTVDVVYEEDIEVTAMNFAQPTQRIANGNSRTMQVVYSPADASFKTAKWTSSNPEVATVDENTGLVTAISEGETTITAEWSENESHGTNISTQMTLTVDKGLVLDRIVYDEMEDATAEVMGYYHPMDGDTLFLPAYIESNGREIPVSFIKQEAFIGSNLKSIVIPGTVKTIDHRALMYSNTHNAYNEMPEEGLESAFLLEGVEVMRDRIFHGNKYMKKVFLPSTLTDIGYYSFFDTAIEDVYFGGTAEQWNALKNLENAKLPESIKIHFNSDFTTAFINSIEVEEDYAEIAVGEEYEVKVSIIPEEIAPVVALTYTSSNEEVATVDEEGVVTGIADGYVTITVSAGEGLEAKVRVKVGDAARDYTTPLLTTWSVQGGANPEGIFVDEEEHYYNNWGAGTSWFAQAYAQFDLSNLMADDDFKATFTVWVNCARGTRTFDICGLPAGTTVADCQALTAKKGVELATYSDITTEYTAKEVDVTEYLKTILSEGATTAIFIMSNGAAGGKIYGKGSAEFAPTLNIYPANGSEGGNQATGINEAKAEKSVKNGKYVENGQIVIYIDGKKFNAAGQQMK